MTDYDPTVDCLRRCVDCGPTTRRLLGRGLCSCCYKRRLRAGTLDEVPAPLLGLDRAHAWLTSMIGTPGCWRWPGSKTHGYGYVKVKGIDVAVHRLSHERFVAPIPNGFFIDHECHNRDIGCFLNEKCPHRACANPTHLAAVPPGVNAVTGHSAIALNRTKTHCPKRHPYSGDNLYVVPRTGARRCRECTNARRRRPRDAA